MLSEPGVLHKSYFTEDICPLQKSTFESEPRTFNKYDNGEGGCPPSIRIPLDSLTQRDRYRHPPSTRFLFLQDRRHAGAICETSLNPPFHTT